MVMHLMKKTLLYVPLLLLVTLIAACGSNGTSTTTGTTSATATTTAAKNCPTTASGTINSVSNTTLLFTNRQGTEEQATFDSSTVIIQQGSGTTTDLKEGTPVTTTVQQGSNNTYTALTISLRNGAALAASRLGSLRGCLGTRRNGTSGTGGAGTGLGNLPGVFGTATAGRQSVSGTIAQLSGSTLVITDASGNDFSIQVTKTTRINKTGTGTASDLKSGLTVTMLGTKDSQGVFHATYIVISARIPRVTTNNG
jgi:hypothetical protein